MEIVEDGLLSGTYIENTRKMYLVGARRIHVTEIGVLINHLYELL